LWGARERGVKHRKKGWFVDEDEKESVVAVSVGKNIKKMGEKRKA